MMSPTRTRVVDGMIRGTFACRYCEHLKNVAPARRRYIGVCELGLRPKTCHKFELAKIYEGKAPWK